MVNREDLIRRAADLVPVLRQIPQAPLDDFYSLGILRAAQPTRFGGYDIDYPVVLDIAAELGRGCGSAAWCYGIWAAHNWAAGMFPEKAQEEYWSATAVDSPSTASPAVPEGGSLHAWHIAGTVAPWAPVQWESPR